MTGHAVVAWVCAAAFLLICGWIRAHWHQPIELVEAALADDSCVLWVTCDCPGCTAAADLWASRQPAHVTACAHLYTQEGQR